MTQRFSDRDEYTRAKLSGKEKEIIEKDLQDPTVNVPDPTEAEDEAERSDNPYDTENQFTEQGGAGQYGDSDSSYGHEGSLPGSDRNRYGTKGSQDQYGNQQ